MQDLHNSLLPVSSVRKYVNCGARVALSANASSVCESSSSPKVESSEGWRAPVHSRILLPSTLFLPGWKVSPLRWIPFECAHHWPRTGCSGGENSGILMQQIFLADQLQLNWVSLQLFLSLLSSRLHCNMKSELSSMQKLLITFLSLQSLAVVKFS